MSLNEESFSSQQSGQFPLVYRDSGRELGIPHQAPLSVVGIPRSSRVKKLARTDCPALGRRRMIKRGPWHCVPEAQEWWAIIGLIITSIRRLTCMASAIRLKMSDWITSVSDPAHCIAWLVKPDEIVPQHTFVFELNEAYAVCLEFILEDNACLWFDGS